MYSKYPSETASQIGQKMYAELDFVHLELIRLDNWSVVIC